MLRKSLVALVTGALCLATLPLSAAEPTSTELQKQIEELKAQIEALAEKAEKAAKKEEAEAKKTHIGGYGELHYNNLEDDAGVETKRMDLHRFVLFFGHDFTEDARLVSEVEIEHALSGAGNVPNGTRSKPGEVELEQAYLEFDLSDRTRAKGGLFLVPVGILNETHEPTTFYGVERNPVENNIIPTTWWEGGGAISGQIADSDFAYDLAVHSGLELPVTGGNAYRVRNGRQKVAEANAHSLASTGRIKYTGIAGLELAASAQYQGDATQELDSEDVTAWLYEAHAAYASGPFGLRALYAQWDFDGNGPAAADRDKQDGYYIEPSYKILPSVGLFARYNVWDNGGAGATEISQTDVGFNWWPIDNVVLKADYQKQGKAGSNDGFNLGLGYRF